MASILIIEDVPAVLLSLRIVLEGPGYQITSATDGTAGLALLASRSFDLVITDIWMPGSSGAEVIREGRKGAPQTRFLAITGGNPNSDSGPPALGPQEYGADAVLIKPFEKADLLGAVTRLLNPA
jgi:CheY-like chemotaxis protein